MKNHDFKLSLRKNQIDDITVDFVFLFYSLIATLVYNSDNCDHRYKINFKEILFNSKVIIILFNIEVQFLVTSAKLSISTKH